MWIYTFLITTDVEQLFSYASWQFRNCFLKCHFFAHLILSCLTISHFIYFRNKFFFGFIYCRCIFYPVVCLFNLIVMSCWIKVLNFNISNLVVFSSIVNVFCVLFKKSLGYLTRSWRYFILSFRSLTIFFLFDLYKWCEISQDLPTT